MASALSFQLRLVASQSAAIQQCWEPRTKRLCPGHGMFSSSPCFVRICHRDSGEAPCWDRLRRNRHRGVALLSPELADGVHQEQGTVMNDTIGDRRRQPRRALLSASTRCKSSVRCTRCGWSAVLCRKKHHGCRAKAWGDVTLRYESTHVQPGIVHIRFCWWDTSQRISAGEISSMQQDKEWAAFPLVESRSPCARRRHQARIRRSAALTGIAAEVSEDDRV